MEDKLMEEFDVDFMNEILGPTELQMADNMIHDLMGELNSETNSINQAQPSNLNEPIWIDDSFNKSACNTFVNQNQNLNNYQHFDQHNSIQLNQNVLLNSQNQILLTPVLDVTQNYLATTNTNFNYSNNNININPIVEQQNIFLLGDNNINQNNQISGLKKTRKNLKDILKDENTIKNNTNQVNNINPYSSLNCLINGSSTNRAELMNVSPVLSPVQSHVSMPISPLSPIAKQQQNNFSPMTQLTADSKGQNILSEKIFQINPSNVQIVTNMAIPHDTTYLQNNLNQPTIKTSTSNTTLVKAESNTDLENLKENQLILSENSKAKPKTRSIKQNENKSPKIDPLKNLVHSENTCVKKNQKVPKRTSHNAIEKKYRSSINDKIVELKSKVAGPDAKLQKSGILKKALEHINGLEEVNRKLNEQNKHLRSALQTISLNSNNLTVIQNVLRNINFNNLNEKSVLDSSMPNTPPSSSSSIDGDSMFSMSDSESSLSQPQTPNSSITQLNQNLKSVHSSIGPDFDSKITKSKSNKKQKKEAMFDSSRIMLCMFVMSVLFFNPFNLIIPSSIEQNSNSIQSSVGKFQNNEHVNSRVLNSYEDQQDLFDNSFNSTSKMILNKKYFGLSSIISWSLNLILILVCLIKIYISGEAYIELSFKTNENLWLFYQKASKNFQKKNYQEAFNYCESGLKELGQTVPKTKFQLFLGIIWQLNKLVFNKLYIGILFSKFGIWLYGLKSPKMYKLSALFYYEMHKISYINMKSENDFVPKTTTTSSIYASSYFINNTTTYSFLSSIYYILTIYNMSELYKRLDTHAKETNKRDEYDLCEFYFSIFLFIKFLLPSKISKYFAKYLIKENLSKRINQNTDSTANTFSKLNNVKNLLNKDYFLDYLLSNFENNNNCLEINDLYLCKKQKCLNLIQYKRKLFSSTFLYDSDESVSNFDVVGKPNNFESNINSANGVACDYVLSKYRDFILLKMTNHIVNQSGIVSLSQMIDIDSDEQQIELAEVDQTKFDELKSIYFNNLDYFTASDLNKNSNAIQKETNFILIEFLDMLNNWKLRKFDHKINLKQLKNSQNSLFIEAIINVLNSFYFINKQPEKALEDCKKAEFLLKSFNKNSNNHSYLLEKFELLIYDWMLSAQTYLWTKNRLFDLRLFNQSLQKFKIVSLNYPELHYKIKMYETVLMVTSNRNPINLLKTNYKHNLISKCNQEAFYSINSILKKFHLQILE